MSLVKRPISGGKISELAACVNAALGILHMDLSSALLMRRLMHTALKQCLTIFFLMYLFNLIVSPVNRKQHTMSNYFWS
jgi:hypothetical protein